MSERAPEPRYGRAHLRIRSMREDIEAIGLDPTAGMPLRVERAVAAFKACRASIVNHEKAPGAAKLLPVAVEAALDEIQKFQQHEWEREKE